MYPQVKRFIDLTLTILTVIFLSPVMALTALLVRFNLGAPVIFCQQRPGLHGRPFTIYKFRTMTNDRDESGHLLPDSKRMTRFGHLLRSTSLDELPELWNVLKGDMSLIGPRPLLVEYLPRYTQEQMRRHQVRPGITGWAQVNGRNALSWEEKFELDIWYVDHRSFLLDLKIFGLTLMKLVTREGITAPDHATVPEFMGSETESKVVR